MCWETHVVTDAVGWMRYCVAAKAIPYTVGQEETGEREGGDPQGRTSSNYQKPVPAPCAINTTSS